MKLKKIASLISGYLSLGVGSPLTSLPSTIQANGNILDAASTVKRAEPDVHGFWKC